MPGTEIDDIFSGKASTMIEPKAVSSGGGGKGKSLKSGAAQTTTMRDGEGKKRQKKKKEKERGVVASYKKDEEEVGGTLRNETETENQEEAEKPATSPTKKPKKRPREEVEEVVDPSITVKKPRLEKDGKSQKTKEDPAKTNKGGRVKTDLDRFKDSRGSGGRKSLAYRCSEDGLISFPCRKTDGRRVSDIHRRRVGHE